MAGITLNPDRRERLRKLLRDASILYSRDGHSIFDYKGKPMRWIYYQWAVSLLPEGATLLSESLLGILSTFDSTVIATVGMTGATLVGALIATSGGRYQGLCIRKEREKHGTRRLIEGMADKSQRVVVVDDCICSGNSLKAAFSALEEEGYVVEGAVAVVHFPWRGGVEWARSLGYRVETIFDIRKDLEAEWDDPPESSEAAEPDQQFLRTVPDGLSPADAACWVSKFYFTHGEIPAAPQTLTGDFDAGGGLMISFRDRKTDLRIARNGFYRFEAGHSIAEDVVRVTAKILRSSGKALAQYGLDRLKVAVTFIGANEEIGPSGLDFSRYGILARSAVSPNRYGAALPNTQFFTSEIEQFRHARFTNAKLSEFEPFVLFRHLVTKSVQTDCTWPAFGISSSPSEPPDQFGVKVVRRIRAILEGGKPSGDILLSILPEARPISGVAVSLYRRGMIGCWTSFSGDLDQMVHDATEKAWADERYKAKKAEIKPNEAEIVVSLFYDSEKLGKVNSDAAANKVRLGKDSLFATNGKENGFILAHIPVQYDWSKKSFAQSVLRKANISSGPCWWTTYATKSWLSRVEGVSVLDSGYPIRSQTVKSDHLESIRHIASYIIGQFDASGLPSYSYHPITNQTRTLGSSVRTLLALEALLDASSVLADRFCEAISMSGSLPALTLRGASNGVAAEVALVSAVYRTGDPQLLAHSGLLSLRHRLDELFHDDGVISMRPHGHRMNIDHDLFPGSALRMAARIAAIEGVQSLPSRLSSYLSWYRRRFHLQHPWGMIWWQLQGWAAIHSVTGDSEPLPFLYEMADWALLNQLQANGAFLVDYATDGPGFHTGCVLEGIADAWLTARLQGETSRSAAYEDAWKRGARFLERLICRPEDTFAMTEPLRCIGGVRAALTTSSFRIDFAAHTLSAFCKGLRASGNVKRSQLLSS